MAKDEFQSPKTLGRFIMRECLFGALATGGDSGYPFVSLVGIASLANGAPLMLLSNLARHSHNLRKDPRVSLLLQEKAATPLEAASLTLTGRIVLTEKSEVRNRYLVRHPEVVSFVDRSEFVFWSIAVAEGHLVTANGRAADLTPEELLGTGGLSWPRPLSGG